MRLSKSIQTHLKEVINYFEDTEGRDFEKHVINGIDPKEHVMWHVLMIQHLLMGKLHPKAVIEQIIFHKEEQVKPSSELAEDKILGSTLMTASDAAKKLHLNIATLANWRVRGDGPKYAKIGRRILYPVDEIEKFIIGSIRSHTSEKK